MQRHPCAVLPAPQIRGVLYCLENLGPWCAAAAAYLDLLAPPAEEDREGELEAASLGDQDDMNDRELTAQDCQCGICRDGTPSRCACAAAWRTCLCYVWVHDK